MGLYQLIGGSRNQELTAAKIKLLLEKRHFTDQEKKRLIAWVRELEFWEEYAEIYYHLEDTRPYFRLAQTIYELIAPSRDEIWLDAGCGPAKMSELIWRKSRQQVKRIIGVDIILRPAQARLASLDSSFPLELRYASFGEKLPFPENFFDGIVANLVLPYIIDFEGKQGKEALKGVLGEMFRILKPEGHLVWSTPIQNVRFQWVFLASLPDMLNIKKQIRHGGFGLKIGGRILKHALEIQRKGKEGIYTFLPKEELESLLFQIGFEKSTWRKTFASQVWVNRVYKPLTFS